MEGSKPVSTFDDDLRPEYVINELVRVPAERIRRRTERQMDILEHTSAFPEFDEFPPGFEWDPRKAEKNVKKHGITFNEASTSFNDSLGMYAYDPDHSQDEDRHLLIGHSARGRLLIISHTDREGTTRLISAREALPRERRDFENGVFR